MEEKRFTRIGSADGRFDREAKTIVALVSATMVGFQGSSPAGFFNAGFENREKKMNTFHLPGMDSDLAAQSVQAPHSYSKRGETAVRGHAVRSSEERSRPIRQTRGQEIQAAVLASLSESGYAALYFVSCEVNGDQIILRGTVPSYHIKQLAQVFAQRVDGVRRVQNCLEVRRRLR